MNWTEIITALLSLIGAAIGTIYGIHRSSSLLEYRIGQLEDKMDKHNQIQERVLIAEQQIKRHSADVEAMKTSVARYSEQIDNIYEALEKIENKVELIEKSIISRIGG